MSYILHVVLRLFFVAMVKIMEIESHLSQAKLDDLCLQCHIPSFVHPILSDPSQAINQYHPGKIGFCSWFFDYADLRLPLSIFFVEVLKHYRINISQLSFFCACKLFHFDVLCRAHNIVPTVALFRRLYVNSIKNGWLSFSKRAKDTYTWYGKPLDSIKGWQDRFFWVDAFAYPSIFPWHTSDTIKVDSVPKPSEYSEDEYNTLIGRPAPFFRYPEAFLCWVGLSR